MANATEWYDFAVFGAMASVLVGVLVAPGPDESGLILIFAVFASSFVARPLGAVLVGVWADRAGRRDALAAMVLLMTGATAAIGLLPPWSVVGGAVTLVLVLLRVTQGFSSGGQISTSIPFLLESVPRKHWGRYAGWHTATVALGIAAGIAVAGVTTAVLPRDALDTWGWRLPFLLALPLGLAGLYIRSRLSETGDFAAQDGMRHPPRPSLRGHARTVATGYLLAGVLAVTFNLWFVFLPSHLSMRGTHDISTALGSAALGLVVTAATAPVLGAWSDRFGRRPLLVASTGALCVLPWPMYAAATDGETPLLLASHLVVGAALGGLVVAAHVAERFPVGVRATGIALTYGLATATLGGTAPLVGAVLARHGWLQGIPTYVSALSAVGLVAVLGSRGGDTTGLPATGDADSHPLGDREQHGPDNRRGGRCDAR